MRYEISWIGNQEGVANIIKQVSDKPEKTKNIWKPPYRCKECNRRFKIQQITDSCILRFCPLCGKETLC